MSIPSGSGSEVLRNASINANDETTALMDFGGTTGTGQVRSSGNTLGVINVPPNVIITILNIIVYVASTQFVSAKIDAQGSTNLITLFYQSVADKGTFVFSDKIVLREGDELQLINTANWADWSINFIYQDWT